ncbi:glycerophosphodiester phosphodiesterase family protein [Oceanicaulis sp.]|uniref:glycerophosphodiester phosphodiesterase family protein n=1 Tax=Oceanicaulis sp. TaxID=1924941 RepID=UPI003F6F3CA8
MKIKTLVISALCFAVSPQAQASVPVHPVLQLLVDAAQAETGCANCLANNRIADRGVYNAAPQSRDFDRAHPENSFLAIEGAERAGLDAVELRVRVTLDGVAMLMSDVTTDRISDNDGSNGGYDPIRDFPHDWPDLNWVEHERFQSIAYERKSSPMFNDQHESYRLKTYGEGGPNVSDVALSDQRLINVLSDVRDAQFGYGPYPMLILDVGDYESLYAAAMAVDATGTYEQVLFNVELTESLLHQSLLGGALEVTAADIVSSLLESLPHADRYWFALDIDGDGLNHCNNGTGCQVRHTHAGQTVTVDPDLLISAFQATGQLVALSLDVPQNGAGWEREEKAHTVRYLGERYEDSLPRIGILHGPDMAYLTPSGQCEAYWFDELGQPHIYDEADFSENHAYAAQMDMVVRPVVARSEYGEDWIENMTTAADAIETYCGR